MCVVWLALCAMAGAAGVPPTAEPGRSTEDLKQPQPAPRSTPEPIVPLRPGAITPENAKGVTFTLREVRITGANALSDSELSSAWSPYLGQKISVATLYEIVNAISARYAAAGYALSFALLPEQDITDGRVKIAVVEGFVDAVTVNGSRVDGTGMLSLGRQIAAQVERIKASRPLRSADLERGLLLLNDLPGINARAVFSASKSTPNASTMTLMIERDVVEGEVNVNNRMSQDFGEWRAGGSVSLNGVVTETSALTATAYHAIDGEGFVFGALRFEQVLTSEGLSAALSGSYSKDVPLEGLLKSIDFEGEDVTGRLEVSYPLIRSRPENLNLSGAFNYSDTRTETLGAPLTEDQVRTLEAAATYDFADRWAGINLVRVSVEQGLDIFGATDDASLLKSRANGSASFTNLKLFASRSQPLVHGLSLFGALEAQGALGDPLLAISECSYGGQSIGRGYDAGALSGDHCVAGLAELRLDRFWRSIGIQLYGFADGAYIRQKGVLEPGEERSEQATSAGGGVRLYYGPVNLNAEVALPLRDRFTDDGEGDPRAFFSATARF